MVKYLKEANISIPEDFGFTQCLELLPLTQTQRHLALLPLGSGNYSRSISGLRDITLRLFGTFRDSISHTYLTLDSSEESAEGDDANEYPTLFTGGKKPQK